MQGRSSQFDATIQKPHTAVPRADVIQDGKVVDQLAVHAGSVSADRTAAQMRTFEVEVSASEGSPLIPVGMTSELAPFGTRMQLWRGVRISNVQTQAVLYNAANPWVVSGTSTGVLNSVKVDGSGNLTLGP
jgi:hypothetical protein